MTEEEMVEEFEEYFRYQYCDDIMTAHCLSVLRSDLNYFGMKQAYLQACRKRQKKWNKLRHILAINTEERVLKIMDDLEDK